MLARNLYTVMTMAMVQHVGRLTFKDAIICEFELHSSAPFVTGNGVFVGRVQKRLLGAHPAANIGTGKVDSRYVCPPPALQQDLGCEVQIYAFYIKWSTYMRHLYHYKNCL